MGLPNPTSDAYFHIVAIYGPVCIVYLVAQREEQLVWTPLQRFEGRTDLQCVTYQQWDIIISELRFTREAT